MDLENWKLHLSQKREEGSKGAKGVNVRKASLTGVFALELLELARSYCTALNNRNFESGASAAVLDLEGNLLLFL